MTKAVCIKDLSVRYGAIEAISNISFDIEEGEYLGIIGPNGGGKSTLLKAILNLIPTTSGSIEIYGQPCGHLSGKNRTKIGYVPQFADIDREFPISVLEVVLTGRLYKGLALFRKYSAEDKKIALEQLEAVGLLELKDRQVSELSGGEFQRMLIARALAVQPKILILDEPTASVDAASKEQIYKLLKKLNEKITVILVTHDIMAVLSEVDKIACLNGSLIYHGEPKLNDHIIHELYGCPIENISSKVGLK